MQQFKKIPPVYLRRALLVAIVMMLPYFAKGVFYGFDRPESFKYISIELVAVLVVVVTLEEQLR